MLVPEYFLRIPNSRLIVSITDLENFQRLSRGEAGMEGWTQRGQLASWLKGDLLIL